MMYLIYEMSLNSGAGHASSTGEITSDEKWVIIMLCLMAVIFVGWAIVDSVKRDKK